MKNRLIELLGKADETTEILTGDFPTYEEELKAFYSGIADYLLDNGVIVLPCAVGDTVYYILRDKIVEGKISMLQQKADKSWKIRITRNGNVHDITLDEIGKHYFLAKEEVERKLKELEKEVE